jgi:hypothetical protein
LILTSLQNCLQFEQWVAKSVVHIAWVVPQSVRSLRTSGNFQEFTIYHTSIENTGDVIAVSCFYMVPRRARVRDIKCVLQQHMHMYVILSVNGCMPLPIQYAKILFFTAYNTWYCI